MLTPAATFKGNRWPFTPAGRIANSVRIALVGDSMVYGQGVPYLQTLGARLARHLNVARPALWFDCQTFGLPGACAFHALTRVESQAAAIDPDLVIIGLSQNDALMLRPQPPSETATGSSWVEFEPHLRVAFAQFGQRWRASHRAPVVVVYFDWCSELAGIRPADTLRPICEEAGLLFLDGTEPLAGTPAQDQWVSPSDWHLNATAHDRVARQLARAVLSQPWIPDGPDYDDPAWLDSFEQSASSLTDADIPEAIAASEALGTLRTKWLERRNRSRSAHEPRFRAIESRLLRKAQQAWGPVILTSFQREIAELPSISLQISEIEDHIHRASTLAHALRHASVTGSLGQPVEGLLSRWADGARFEVEEIEPARRRAEARASRASAIVDAVHTRGSNAAELRGLVTMAAHARSANNMAVSGLAELQRLVDGGLPAATDVQRVVLDALALWRVVDDGLIDADVRTGWPPAAHLLDGFAPERANMTLTLNVMAAPGPEQWVYRVGAYSPAQRVHESYVACGWLHRDGRAIAYPIDLPVMVSSTITLSVSGEGLGTAARSDVLRVLPARLEAPGVPPLEFPMSRATRVSETACVIEFTPNLFTRTQ